MSKEPSIIVSAQAFSAMCRHAEEAYPLECCGILVGRRLGTGSAVAPELASRNTPSRSTPSAGAAAGTVAEESVPTRNVASDPATTYCIAPEDLLAQHLRVREERRIIVGYYHSHPNGEARPSRRDLEEAWPEHCYFIVAVREGRFCGLRAFAVPARGEDFVELAWEVEGGP